MGDPAADFPATVSAVQAAVEQFGGGAQVYLSRGATPLLDIAFGELRPGVAMTPDSVLFWFSAGKPLTAICIARLWEAGRLDLDDPVARFIPEFAQRGKEIITVRQLLTHTAGIRWVEPADDWDEMIARICAARIEPRWIPGKTAGYHAATSWYLLGEILRRCDETQRPFEKIIEDEIFQPLGMTDCYFAMSAEQFRSISPHSATLIIWAEAKTPPPAFATEAGCSRASPGASARGPARQLGKFYEMMLNRGRPLLMRQTVEALVARHRAGIQDLTFKRIIDWGLGFIVNSAQYSQPDLPYGFGPHASLRSFGHGGNQSSIGFADPENALAAVIVFSSLPGEEAHQRRMVRILAAIYEDLKIVPPAAV